MEKQLGLNGLIQIITDINPAAGYWLNQDPSVGLLESDAIDSINVMAIINQLEKRYNFVFEASDIQFAHFKNLESLLDLLYSKYNFVPTT